MKSLRQQHSDIETAHAFSLEEREADDNEDNDPESKSVSDNELLVGMQKIFSLEKDLYEASYELIQCQEAARSAKKAVETAQDRLNSYIRNLNKKMPLFDRERD